MPAATRIVRHYGGIRPVDSATTSSMAFFLFFLRSSINFPISGIAHTATDFFGLFVEWHFTAHLALWEIGDFPRQALFQVTGQ